MRSSRSTYARAIVPASFVVAMAVFSSGCVAQDRPHEVETFVVANAGLDRVVEVASVALFEWPEGKAIEVEGNATHATGASYLWRAMSSDSTTTGTEANFSVASQTPGSALVTLRVTAEKTTAADAAGVLFVPGPADSSQLIYIATRGDIVSLGDFHWVVISVEDGPFRLVSPAGGLHFPSDRFARVALGLKAPLGEVPESSILMAVKDGAGPARATTTQMLEFETGRDYTLLVDTSAAAQHRMVAREGGEEKENVTLEEFRTAHGVAEQEVRVQIVAIQTLPGAEGVAAAVAITAAGLFAARRRGRR